MWQEWRNWWPASRSAVRVLGRDAFVNSQVADSTGGLRRHFADELGAFLAVDAVLDRVLESLGDANPGRGRFQRNRQRARGGHGKLHLEPGSGERFLLVALDG